MRLEDRLSLVASTWTPLQRLHPGNVAWHAAGGDGAPPADVDLDGPGWFAEAWLRTDSRGMVEAEVDLHVSPRLGQRDLCGVLARLRDVAPRGTLDLVTCDPMAATVCADGGRVVEGGPFFLLQHRTLTGAPQEPHRLPDGYRIVTAEEAGDEARVRAHRDAWAPARIKSLLGLPVSGDEPESRFSSETLRAVRDTGLHRDELDLVVLAPDGEPAAYTLGWLDEGSRSVLFEPVGTAPAHARRGLSSAVCAHLLGTAVGLGARQAVVGPRGDDGYPVPRRLYESLGFAAVARTATFAW